MYTPKPHSSSDAYVAGRLGIPPYEGGRVLFTSVEGDPRSEDWTPSVATFDGNRYDILARRASCGLGCQCASEFKFGESVFKEHLEYLRQEIRNESISWSEIYELQALSDLIEEGDVELLEWAGVSEFEFEERG
jgi:hypothetical protein